MRRTPIAPALAGWTLSLLALWPGAQAADIQIGASGKTFASSGASCGVEPASGQRRPQVEAGLFNPKRGATAQVTLNGVAVASVGTAAPAATVWLQDGDSAVVVALSRRLADRYAFSVSPGACDLPDTSGNTFSADGTLQYAASGKSYATVTPGCALNAANGRAQPFVNLFDNGGFLLNVSVNGVPLTQLSATRPHVPVFLAAGQNLISAANGSLSVDHYVRDGGSGSCTLAP